MSLSERFSLTIVNEEQDQDAIVDGHSRRTRRRFGVHVVQSPSC